MFDYHIHPNYSIDAKGSVEEFCQAALERGLEEIAFTTHLDSDPETEDCIISVRGEIVDVHSRIWFEDYENTIRQAAEKYKEDGLTVLVGAELDIYPGVIENIPDAFHDTEWDIVIGSVHLIEHLALSLKEDAEIIFSKYSVSELGNKYFSILLGIIETSLIDIIGHMDIYRRYGEAFYGEEIHNLWKPHIDSLSARMKKHKIGFEINTSSWRKGLAEPMPSTDFVKTLIDSGIDVVTVGSDAHRPQDVGDGINRAIQFLGVCGNLTPSRFRKRTRK